jgi:hypothetical protein
MILYHGATEIIKTPDLAHSRDNIDFGKGFYLTKIKSQAENWAARKSRLDKRTAAVITYEFNNAGLAKLDLTGYTQKWLDFIVNNRTGKIQNETAYDYIEGQVADDDIINEVNAYIALFKEGKATPKVVSFYLELFSYAKENHQICLKSERAIKQLKFIESYEAR